MKISNISVQSDGYIYCRSCFYCCHDTLSSDTTYTLSTGINRMIGDIDSGNWSISYLLSMYKYRHKDFVLFDKPSLAVNGELISIDELCSLACYMDDKFYPLFSSRKTVKKLIEDGLKHRKSNYTYEEIKSIFGLDSQRVECRVAQVGNEKFRAMAAIGLAYGKEIFCFPWLSNKRFESYHQNISKLLECLENLGKIVIVPIGT